MQSRERAYKKEHQVATRTDSERFATPTTNRKRDLKNKNNWYETSVSKEAGVKKRSSVLRLGVEGNAGIDQYSRTTVICISIGYNDQNHEIRTFRVV
jgi:hypothetical protein